MCLFFIFLLVLLIITPFEVESQENFTKFVFPKNRKINSKLRIMGGQEVNPHTYPFMVALYIKILNTSTDFSFCGGTLLNAQWILTAAHCVELNPYSITAYIGLHSLSNYSSVQIINVKSYIFHKDWSSETVQNDIALLMLSKNVTFSSTVQAVEMENKTNDYVGQTAVLLGWGKTEFGVVSDVLKSVNSSIISNRECDRTFGIITSSHICISGQGNKGCCNGDSGGPLLVNNILIGITSFGGEYCNLGLPSGFTRVSYYHSWIEAKMRGGTVWNNLNKVLLLFSTIFLIIV